MFFLALFFILAAAKASDCVARSCESDKKIFIIGSNSVIIDADVAGVTNRVIASGGNITAQEVLKQMIEIRSFAMVLKMSGYASNFAVNPHLEGYFADEFLFSQYVMAIKNAVVVSEDEVVARKKMYSDSGVDFENRKILPFKCVFIPFDKKNDGKIENIAREVKDVDSVVNGVAANGFAYEISSGNFDYNSLGAIRGADLKSKKMISVIKNFGVFVYFFDDVAILKLDDDAIRNEIREEKLKFEMNSLKSVIPIVCEVF